MQSSTSDLSEPPAVVAMASDTNSFILGNEGGFIYLAIASLKAASGEEQKFKDQEWMTEEDLDWTIAGLRPDALAHRYLPKKQTKLQRVRRALFGWSLLFLVLLCLGTGLVTILNWVFRWY